MSQMKALEGLIRRVIREEIAAAVPDIAQYLSESMTPVVRAPSAPPSRRMETDNSSVRALLREHVGWEDGSPGFINESVAMPSHYTPAAPSRPSIIMPERGVDGGPVPGINPATQPVYEAINQDFSAIMKKLNLV